MPGRHAASNGDIGWRRRGGLRLFEAGLAAWFSWHRAGRQTGSPRRERWGAYELRYEGPAGFKRLQALACCHFRTALTRAAGARQAGLGLLLSERRLRLNARYRSSRLARLPVHAGAGTRLAIGLASLLNVRGTKRYRRKDSLRATSLGAPGGLDTSRRHDAGQLAPLVSTLEVHFEFTKPAAIALPLAAKGPAQTCATCGTLQR